MNLVAAISAAVQLKKEHLIKKQWGLTPATQVSGSIPNLLLRLQVLFPAELMSQCLISLLLMLPIAAIFKIIATLQEVTQAVS